MITNVRISILDKNNCVLGAMDNCAPGALHFFDDILHTYLKGSAYTFSFKANADHTDAEYLSVGNKLAFRYKDHDYYLNILSAEEDESEIIVDAYGLLFELLNEMVGSFSPANAMTFEQYKQEFDKEGVIIIGNNEVSATAIKNEWTGEETLLARLYSLANTFDAEIEFVTRLRSNYSLDCIVMNVYRKHTANIQGIGNRRDDVILRYGKDIEGITRETDITKLITAICPTGTDGLTIADLDKIELDTSGIVEFESKMGDICIRAVQARERFPSNTNTANDRYITIPWSYDTKNVNVLYGQALARLKELCEPKVSYEVRGYVDLNLGDTVMISDEAFHPPLYVLARVTEQKISFTDENRNETVFNNFIELKNQVDADLLEQMRVLIENNKRYTWIVYADDATGNGISMNASGKSYMGTAVNQVSELPDLTDPQVYRWVQVKGEAGSDSVLLYIDSSNGSMFKNSALSTTLTVVIIVGEKRVDSSRKMYEVFGENAALRWFCKRYGETEFTPISSDDSRLNDNGFIFTLSPNDVDKKAVFNCELDY